MGAAVLVPATSANLGPGFDSFGLALDLHNRFEAELADEWSVQVEGEGAGHLRTDAGNRVASAMARAFEALGRPGLRAHIGCVNNIPLGNGLGSSSSAIVGGILLAEQLLGEDLGETARLELAASIEGHPDNVAAALRGGFTVCWNDAAGSVRTARFQPARGLATVVVVANGELSTKTARAMLPEAVPHADAAFNVAHAGLLAASIATGRPELLGAALADRLHEPYRASAVADLKQVHDILREAGAAGVALSGAGPTMIGLVAGDTDEAAHALAVEVAERAADGVRALGSRRAPAALRIDRAGARLL
ncbi:MAG: homoserine kinase [Coriobacteriia bacterium]|nr:homoserine kinase [Coriobacteriia bacterium]